MSDREIVVQRASSAVGGEIRGLQLGSLTQGEVSLVLDALYEHGMVFARQQSMDHGEQLRFARSLGPLAVDAYTDGVPGYSELQPIFLAKDEVGRAFGEGWHRDSPMLARPPAITILRCVDAPPWGGDTIFASSASAYDALSAGLRAVLDGLSGLYSNAHILRALEAYNKSGGTVEFDPVACAEDIVNATEHDLVLAHPISGRRSLYADPGYTVGIAGFRRAEARPLLQFLWDFQVKPEFTYRLHWEPGTVALWDNRLVLHHAYNDKPRGYGRMMYRAIVEQEHTLGSTQLGVEEHSVPRRSADT